MGNDDMVKDGKSKNRMAARLINLAYFVCIIGIAMASYSLCSGNQAVVHDKDVKTANLVLANPTPAAASDAAAAIRLIEKHATLTGNSAFAQPDVIRSLIASSRGFVGLTPITDKSDDNTDYGRSILSSSVKASDMVSALIGVKYDDVMPKQSATVIGFSADGVLAYVRLASDIAPKFGQLNASLDNDHAWVNMTSRLREVYGLPSQPKEKDRSLEEYPMAIRTSALLGVIAPYVDNEALTLGNIAKNQAASMLNVAQSKERFANAVSLTSH